MFGQGDRKGKFFCRNQGLNRAGTFIPLFREISRSSGKCVSFAVLSTKLENNLEVVLGKFLSQSNLLAREKGLGCECLQVVVVGDDGEGTWELVQVHVPFFKAKHDSK